MCICVCVCFHVCVCVFSCVCMRMTSCPHMYHIFFFSAEKPTSERVLVVPDVSGTVLTTGNMPNVLQSTSFTGETVHLVYAV